MTKQVQIAVCGPAECTDVDRERAYRVGELLARSGATVLCGGGGGVMAAAAAGARAAGGLAVGIGPGVDRPADAFTVAIATNMGQARNVILVLSADAVIAIGGSWGTLSEQALAMRGGVPVVTLGTWRVVDAAGSEIPGFRVATTPEGAVALAVSAAPARPAPP